MKTHPETLPPPAPSDPSPPAAPLTDDSPVAAVEAHQLATSCPVWLHVATAHRLGWGLGRELSLNAYLSATAATAAHPCGG